MGTRAPLHECACALLIAACSGACAGNYAPTGAPLPPTDPAALGTTLADLAAFGEKRVGTAPGAQAGDYVSLRMQEAGLAVHAEAFDFPRYDLVSSSFSWSAAGGASESPGHDVFEASGPGHAEGDVVWVAAATAQDLAGKDLHGKIALVERSVAFHRATQLANVAAAGALAMVYLSIAPNNLRQVGSVRWSWEVAAAIPAITIGADDGARIQAALDAGSAVHAVVDVQASSVPAVGRNIVGVLAGTDPQAGEIVVGAHYDTWFTGSTDNGSGVAGMIAIAERRAKKARPKATLVFVGYDGEEVALFGGYDFLRKHKALASEEILAVLNLETAAATGARDTNMAHSRISNFDEALSAGGLHDLYRADVTMTVVPAIFGGIIPTDIQGLYRSGIPTATTVVDAPWYHTTADTPDKVDAVFLAKVVDAFDRAIDLLTEQGPTCCSAPDPEMWRATATAAPRNAGEPLHIDATITDDSGAPQPNAIADAWLLYDDFFPADHLHGTTDGAGHVSFAFDAAHAEMGRARRYVHVSAGPTYPLCEAVIALP